MRFWLYFRWVYHKIVYLSWEEVEIGWGIRPDGCSLHVSRNDAAKFIMRRRQKQKEKGFEQADEIEQPAGQPVPAYVHPDLFHRIVDTECGLRVFRPDERAIICREYLVFTDERSGWVLDSRCQ